MKREIKFRAFFAKPNGDSTMRYNISVGDDKPIDDLDKFFRLTAKDDLIWMQYTGLKDINGKEIYEGDVVELDESERGEIVYVADREEIPEEYWEDLSDAGFYFKEKDGTYWHILNTMSEVIGNIYENSDLLK